MLINASRGVCRKKNIHDHAAFRISWGMKRVQILSADINETNAISK